MSSTFPLACHICKRRITIEPLDTYRETGEKLVNVVYLFKEPRGRVEYHGLRFVCQGACDRELQRQIREYNAGRRLEDQYCDGFDCLQEITLAPVTEGWENQMAALEADKMVSFSEAFRLQFAEVRAYVRASRRDGSTTFERERARVLRRNFQ